MSKKLAIRGHSTRGKEVIELLEMLGGKNNCDSPADNLGLCYLIDDEFDICAHYFGYDDYEDGGLNIFTLEEFLEKYPYKVGDKAVYIDDNDIVVISEIMWDDTVGDIFYNVKRIDDDDYFLCPPELLKPYKEIQNENMETKTHRGYYTTEEEITNKSKKVAWFTFWDNDFADKVELDLNGRELIQENGKWFVVKKKPKYPKTFEECLNMLYCKSVLRTIIGHKAELLLNLEKLLVCRDAYWKIAGEEMGLGKSWEHNYLKDANTIRYAIYNTGDEIIKLDGKLYRNYILCFPTEEMRDSFHENFKELIESCKELL